MADLKKDNEKLSREVGAKDGLADSDLSNVAGGEGEAYNKLISGLATKANQDGSILNADLSNSAGSDSGAYNKLVSGWAKKAKKDGSI